jgi:glycosyltransferase involved in cell wall biosynthesis
MDAVIVPSRFCAQVFRRGGVKAPIAVCPLGIGEAYKPAKRAQGRPLTFLAFLDRGERKGGLAAQQAFSLAFGDDPSVRLILKMRDRRVPQAILNDNITLIQRDMTEQELYQLYLSADVLINPNKGEGFGLIPREFAATGGVSLATDWSGTADDLSAWGWPLPYTLEPALWDGNAKLSGLDLGEWARPNIEAIAKVLGGIAGNRASYARIAARKAKAAAELYSWRRFAAQVLAVYEEAKVGASHRADRALYQAA